MPLDQRQLKWVAPKWIKKVNGLSQGTRHRLIFIFSCANAVGTMLPPIVICKGEHLNDEWTRAKVKGRVIACHSRP